MALGASFLLFRIQETAKVLILSLFLATIFVAPTVLSDGLGSQNCYGTDDFPDHGDVREQDMTKGSAACADYSGAVWSGADPVSWVMKFKGTYLRYTVSWIDDCEGNAQDIVNPVAGFVCDDILFNNWKNCK